MELQDSGKNMFWSTLRGKPDKENYLTVPIGSFEPNAN